MNSLILLAHNDDEFFLAPYLKEEVRMGGNIYIAYTTRCVSSQLEPMVRVTESFNALKRLGISEDRIYLLGLEHNIPDGQSHKYLDLIFFNLLKFVENKNIDKIFLPAWEGGHHDHDSCHIIGIQVAKTLKVDEVFEFSLYNGYNRSKPFFNVMYLIPEFGNHIQTIKLGFSDVSFLLKLAFVYTTQRKTFLGLLPGILYNFFVKRRFLIRKVERRNYTVAPHDKLLFYERRFGIPFKETSAYFLTFHQNHIKIGAPYVRY